jgi:hypothetical protein
LVQQYARLADASVLGLPERDDPDLMVRVEAVSSTSSSHGGTPSHRRARQVF